MNMTLEQIRAEGLKALKERLGPAGMVRFLQQFEMGRGDYAKERHAWVDRTSLAALRRQVKASQRRLKRHAKR